MPDKIPLRFDLLRPEGRRGERFDDAISALREGTANSAIRKVVLDAVKSTLSSAVDKAWAQHVKEPFFWAGKYLEQPEGIQTLHYAITVSNLHDCLSTAKKIDRSSLEGPAIDAMKAVLAEALPLAEAVRDLKDHVVKGRAPNPNPPPANPDKEIGTCSCCMRGIAVSDNRMALHGYQRPGNGEQTASCAGIRFPPLETSTRGLEWLVGATDERILRLRERIENKDSVKELYWTERDRKSLSGFTRRHCTDADPDWPQVHARHFANLRSELRITSHRRESFGEELVKWQAFHDVVPEQSDESPSP